MFGEAHELLRVSFSLASLSSMARKGAMNISQSISLLPMMDMIGTVRVPPTTLYPHFCSLYGKTRDDNNNNNYV